jgi:hypothetical protein
MRDADAAAQHSSFRIVKDELHFAKRSHRE